MKVLNYIKTYGTSLPYGVGSQLARVPYSFRPVVGSQYRATRDLMSLVSHKNHEDKKDFILSKVQRITAYAYNNTHFYKRFYDDRSFKPESIRSYEDIDAIPIVKKSDFLEFTLEERSVDRKGRYVVNTGGSSGSTLDLYITPDSIGREWAHMHDVWRRLGFTQDQVKVVFSGQSKTGKAVTYDSARHQFNINVFLDWSTIRDELKEIYTRYSPQYIHGYPGSIFDFVLWIAENDKQFLRMMKNSTKGMMLSSEYPNPITRTEVEDLLGCDSVSWYGHTERAVLAREVNEKGFYEPFLSYGLCQIDNGSPVGNLTATSYFNLATPLVRFNTEDEISSTTESGILIGFNVTGGRNSEFIVDRNGHQVSLTALIYGRHHAIFDHVSNIQVRQVSNGQIDVLYVRRNNMTAEFNAEQLFSASGVDVEINFFEIESPYKNPNGKTPLLVRT